MGFTNPISHMGEMRLKEFKTLNHLGSCENADSDSGPGWGLRCCISHQLPGGAHAAGP